jgi:hypothetical protein
MVKLANALGILGLLLWCGVLNSGCRSVNGPASTSFASVTLNGPTVEQIRQTTTTVFRENGYQALASGEKLVFEREGSLANTLSRDGLLAAQGGARTMVRVRAEVVDLGTGARRLQCQAYMVSGAGDSFFEEEHRVSNLSRRPYQNLLDQVAKRLQQP